MLPNKVETLEEQAYRLYLQFHQKETPLEKHIFLMQLHDFNSTVFYKLVGDHMEEMLPIIYTPTVGESVQNFSLQMRRPRGVYIDYEDQQMMDRLLPFVISTTTNNSTTVIRIIRRHRPHPRHRRCLFCCCCCCCCC